MLRIVTVILGKKEKLDCIDICKQNFETEFWTLYIIIRDLLSDIHNKGKMKSNSNKIVDTKFSIRKLI